MKSFQKVSGAVFDVYRWLLCRSLLFCWTMHASADFLNFSWRMIGYYRGLRLALKWRKKLKRVDLGLAMCYLALKSMVCSVYAGGDDVVDKQTEKKELEWQAACHLVAWEGMGATLE